MALPTSILVTTHRHLRPLRPSASQVVTVEIEESEVSVELIRKRRTIGNGSIRTMKWLMESESGLSRMRIKAKTRNRRLRRAIVRTSTISRRVRLIIPKELSHRHREASAVPKNTILVIAI